jgi:hypothetical protein
VHCITTPTIFCQYVCIAFDGRHCKISRAFGFPRFNFGQTFFFFSAVEAGSNAPPALHPARAGFHHLQQKRLPRAPNKSPATFIPPSISGPSSLIGRPPSLYFQTAFFSIDQQTYYYADAFPVAHAVQPGADRLRCAEARSSTPDHVSALELLQQRQPDDLVEISAPAIKDDVFQ